MVPSRSAIVCHESFGSERFEEPEGGAFSGTLDPWQHPPFAEVIRKFTWENASRLYRHPVPDTVQHDPEAF